jgi:hypothetical protein
VGEGFVFCWWDERIKSRKLAGCIRRDACHTNTRFVVMDTEPEIHIQSIYMYVKEHRFLSNYNNSKHAFSKQSR